MKKETKLTLSIILILLSIIVISASLAYLKNNAHLLLEVPTISIIIMSVFSFVFSVCFLYLLFSKLGTLPFTGEKIVTYILFIIGLSFFLSRIFYYIGNSFL